MTETPRLPYPSDLSDARWALIEPILTEWRTTRGGLELFEPTHDLREIANAIQYLNRTGMAWGYLPHDFPPHKTVYDYFAKWRDDGTTERIHDALRRRVRLAAGRKAEPTAAILDAQSVKTSSNVPESSQGIDAGKKIKGRKRHIAIDTLGMLLVVLVTAASVQDSAGGIRLIEGLAKSFPTVVKAWVDSGYKRGVIEKGAANGVDVEVVKKDEAVKGFVPNIRWPVERTLGWLMLHRRLVRDYETNPESFRAMIHWAMIDNMARRVTRESTPTWHFNAENSGIHLLI